MTNIDFDANNAAYNDAVDDVQDDRHEQDDDLNSKRDRFVPGAVAVQKRYGSTIDSITVQPLAVDAELIGFDELNAEPPVRDTGGNVVRLVADEAAKRQSRSKLAEARKAFDMSVLNEKNAGAKPAANDNEPVETWLLMEAINRKRNPTERARLKDTALYLRDRVDTAGTDPLGLSVHRPGKEPTPDFDMDRTASGAIYYGETGMTLDRKRRRYTQKNGESDAERHDGPVRTSKRSAPISSGYNVFRDDPIVQHRLDAEIELEDLAAVVGPLWSPLMDAICRNTGFTEIAARWGYSQPVVGSFAVMLALEVAAKHIEGYREAESFRDFVETHSLPVAARRYRRAMAGSGTLKLVA